MRKIIQAKYVNSKDELESELSGPGYHFMIPAEVSVKEGDCIVVSNSDGKMKICKVTVPSFTEEQEKELLKKKGHESVYALNDAMAVVDFSAYLQYRKKQERKQEILNDLAEKKKKFDQYAIYEIMAKSNPVVAAMLEELKALDD